MIRLLVAGALGAFGFALSVGSPRRCLLGGALTGLLSALIFGLLVKAGHAAPPLAAGAGAFLAALAAELLARWQRVTAVAFLVPGLIPLVPGVTVYRAMLGYVEGHYAMGGQEAVLALLWAGAMAFGVVLAQSIVRARPSAARP